MIRGSNFFAGNTNGTIRIQFAILKQTYNLPLFSVCATLHYIVTHILSTGVFLRQIPRALPTPTVIRIQRNIYVALTAITHKYLSLFKLAVVAHDALVQRKPNLWEIIGVFAVKPFLPDIEVRNLLVRGFDSSIILGDTMVGISNRFAMSIRKFSIKSGRIHFYFGEVIAVMIKILLTINYSTFRVQREVIKHLYPAIFSVKRIDVFLSGKFSILSRFRTSACGKDKVVFSD